MEVQKTTIKKITLVNNTNLSTKGKRTQDLNVSGLGKVKTPKYRYNDTCSNGMK